MEQSPVEIIQAILADPTNPEVAERFVAADAAYVSLNCENPELNRIMPWAGTQQGPQAIIPPRLREENRRM